MHTGGGQWSYRRRLKGEETANIPLVIRTPMALKLAIASDPTESRHPVLWWGVKPTVWSGSTRRDDYHYDMACLDTQEKHERARGPYRSSVRDGRSMQMHDWLVRATFRDDTRDATMIADGRSITHTGVGIQAGDDDHGVTFGEMGWFGGLAPCSCPREGSEHRTVTEESCLLAPRRGFRIPPYRSAIAAARQHRFQPIETLGQETVGCPRMSAMPQATGSARPISDAC
jgi:hypothetical protein